MLILRIIKETVEIFKTHKEKRGIGEFNIHRTKKERETEESSK